MLKLPIRQQIWPSFRGAFFSQVIPRRVAQGTDCVGPAWASVPGEKGKEIMVTCTEPHHVEHSHAHGPNCGHTAIRHADHVDYLHDGHLHHPHEDHVDEHVIAADATNPVQCTPETVCSHTHGPSCGHEAVPHGDHID